MMPAKKMQSIIGNTSVLFGAVLMIVVTVPAIFAPLLFTVDPVLLEPSARLQPPSAVYWFGTDLFGRDVYSRAVYGARTSLSIGASVALIAVVLGMIIGAVSGYIRILDAVVMRIMDGLMAIPGLLLAIALISITGASVTTVVIAITIPEIPRVVRLVRSIVLSIREEPYVEAAITVGTKTPMILWRHVLPNTISAILVLATFIFASAVLSEASLGFLGAGIPPEFPSWGNMIAESRIYFQIAPWMIFFPAICLTVTVLGINILGDGLSDTLDPRLAKKI